MSLDVVAGLAGISAGYLSMLERGQRGFNRRGLLDDLAAALGCSVADLTGQSYLAPDRVTADAMTTVPGIELAVHDCTLADVPVANALRLTRTKIEIAAVGLPRTRTATATVTGCASARYAASTTSRPAQSRPR